MTSLRQARTRSHQSEHLRKSARISVLVGTLLFVSACGSYPISRIAVEGTTIAIPVPHNFGAGFGRAISNYVESQMAGGAPFFTTVPASAVAYTHGSDLEDELRGELVFFLEETDPNGALPPQKIAILPVRYITRVHSDESSIGATGADYSNGQVVAFVDIPLGVTAPAHYPGNGFQIRVQRWRRDPAAAGHPFTHEQPQANFSNWPGWTQPNPSPIPIKVYSSQEVPVVEEFHALMGWDVLGAYYAGQNVGGALEVLVPRVKVPVTISRQGSSGTFGAWELEVEYPANKVRVVGAEAGTNLRSEAMLLFKADSASYAPCPSDPTTGRVKVSVLDPYERTLQIRLIVVPRSLDCAGFSVPFVAENDVQPDVAGSFKVYLPNGNDSIATYDVIVGEIR